MKDNRRLSIGAMAQANGVTPRALRVYQQKGIIEPSFVDDQTVNRYYDIHQSRKIDMIHELQSIGFSLEEIEQVSREGDLQGLCKLPLLSTVAACVPPGWRLVASRPFRRLRLRLPPRPNSHRSRRRRLTPRAPSA